MATMISEVYDALRDAGASEEKARKAAEVLANYESRFDRIESDIAAFRAEVRGEFSLVKWMLGFVLVFVVALTFKAFS
jgi:uncharacterized protein Yka (UPF0111/DUF47 family)